MTRPSSPSSGVHAGRGALAAEIGSRPARRPDDRDFLRSYGRFPGCSLGHRTAASCPPGTGAARHWPRPIRGAANAVRGVAVLPSAGREPRDDAGQVEPADLARVPRPGQRREALRADRRGARADGRGGARDRRGGRASSTASLSSSARSGCETRTSTRSTRSRSPSWPAGARPATTPTGCRSCARSPASPPPSGTRAEAIVRRLAP